MIMINEYDQWLWSMIMINNHIWLYMILLWLWLIIILYVYYFKLYSDFPGSDLAAWSQVHLIESDENECEWGIEFDWYVDVSIQLNFIHMLLWIHLNLLHMTYMWIYIQGCCQRCCGRWRFCQVTEIFIYMHWFVFVSELSPSSSSTFYDNQISMSSSSSHI